MLFFLPDFSQPQLPEAEARHCLQVLRKNVGDSIQVCDGKGHFAQAEIATSNPKNCLLRLGDIENRPQTWSGEIWLAVAPTKNIDRMEWLVEKATEMGCNGFYFVKTARTERGHLNLERLEKIALSAMKQSGQAWLPEIHWVDKMTNFPFDSVDHHWLGDLSPNAKSQFSDKETGKHVFWIGPEGDFSQEEMALLQSKKSIGIRLSPNTLRTETAALAAVFLYHFSKHNP